MSTLPTGTLAARRHWTVMRIALLAGVLLLAACSSEPAANNAAAPEPKPTGPPPLTPKMNITPVPGKSPAWMGARPAPGDPSTAPYGNLLDQPVVNGTTR